jgi:tetratricopeptide (TPR) repeat protein
MAPDWFRKNSWSEEDQAAFWQRLSRARKDNHPQYVFIQGHTLMAAGPKYRTNALTLFDYVIDHYPDSLSYVQALSAKADYLSTTEDVEGALLYYDRAIRQMRIMPNNKTWAWIDFVWLIAMKKLSDRYETALDVLNEFGKSAQIFPLAVFRLHACRALIQSDRGLPEVAASAARLALEAADKVTSGLRYHQTLGLVGPNYDVIRTRLRAIARPLS